MALNQTIFSPLANFSGSISSFRSSNFNTLQIVSSSLPTYNATGWKYVIKNPNFTTTSTTDVAVTDLTLNLDPSKKYIIEAYLAVASPRTANGFNVGVSASVAVETYYSVESTPSTTATGFGFNQTVANSASPASSLTNYFFNYIKAVALTRTGVLTWTPTLASEGAGGGDTTVAMGPSFIYYREY